MTEYMVPTDHPILDEIFGKVGATWQFNQMTRESECLEFFDTDQGAWFELVVRRIEGPSDENAAAADS